MPYLLDANSCIQHGGGRSAAITRKRATLQAVEIQLCSVVRAELMYGALRSADPAHNRRLVEHFCGRFVSLPFDDRAADTYATIRADLAATGRLIGPNDLLIAVIALANTVVRVTHNTSMSRRTYGWYARLAFSPSPWYCIAPATRSFVDGVASKPAYSAFRSRPSVEVSASPVFFSVSSKIFMNLRVK
ncbi:MAG TPA: type II toxin-antitoxin system VapC family toxin [Herpetosiphonaceae bacterium]|nr:type II toxin-antitoxin system VapC family toxin [Herpetosiphonaceae bacterium]